MEKEERTRSTKTFASKDLRPAEVLVGFSGRIIHRKLRPLRRTRADKKRELALEQDYSDKCNKIAWQIKNHITLLDLMAELESSGMDLCNITISQELQMRHLDSMALIKYFLDQLGVAVDLLPKDIEDLLHEAMCKDKELRAKLQNTILHSEETSKVPFTGTHDEPSLDAAAVAQRSHIQAKEKFYQVFVHGARKDGPIVLMIRPNEKGRAIREKIGKKCPSLPASFILLHRGRKVCEESSLEYQGLTEDCNLHVHFGLRGGMDKPNSGVNSKGVNSTDIISDPVDEGDNSRKRIDSSGSHLCASDAQNEVTPPQQERILQGPFGVVESFDDIDDYLTIDELAQKTPCDGEVVTVKGFCSRRPRNSGGAGSVFLRNDRHLSNEPFLEVKVDIRACVNSSILTKHIISSILALRLGKPFLVRGRIERLKKAVSPMKSGFQIVPFQIVVDADEHAAVRMEDKSKRSFHRQFSTPWTDTYGLFPAEGVTQEPLFYGDVLKKAYGILYRQPGEDNERIRECVVALKNSTTGDIYIGVDKEGRLVGSKVTRDQIVKIRENMVKIVGGVLPNVNDSVTLCNAANQAYDCVGKGKPFVAVMWLPDDKMCQHDPEESNMIQKVSIVIRIHVVKGTSLLHFGKQEHSHAYTRVGAETKLMTDFEGLFNRLSSLASRNIPERSPDQIEEEVDKASTYHVHGKEISYALFSRVPFETDQRELKIIFGDPKKKILKDGVAKYSASFLNSDGGAIFFGVEENRKTKIGRAVGVSLSEEDRKEILRESSKIICNFWPPVDSTQFQMTFTRVECQVSKNILRYPKTSIEREGMVISVVIHNNSNVPNLLNFAAKTKITSPVAMLRLANNKFSFLVKDGSKVNVEEFVCELEEESKNTKYFSVDATRKEDAEIAVNDLCVVRLYVSASPYPIHLTSPFRTHCLDQHGEVMVMSPAGVLERFSERDYQYDAEKFLKAVNCFEKENTSYILISSPFCLAPQRRDLYGLVVPEWALVLDFDQTPHQEGHLLNIFKPLHDRHQVERNIFVKTPLDRKLALDPSNGVCWCAVRGYEDIADTLSEDGHASWMKTHGIKMRALIEQLVSHINPNQLIVVCLWDEGNENLLPSVDSLLQQIFSFWGPTTVVFVCSSTSAESDVFRKLVEPLSIAGYGIKRENVIVALPHEMARHVGSKLPPPYCSEQTFQIPKKFFLPGRNERTIPDILPQTIRQAIKGHLQIMYLNTGSNAKPTEVEKVRVEFYSGLEINDVGLANGIAIQRTKMKEVKKALKSFVTDKRSHVCLTVLKAERGAGATTLCLQLLYEFHKQYVCAQLVEFHDNLVSNIEKINQHSRLPLILFVDSEMANLPEFNDFKNQAERKHLDLKFLIVESDLYTHQTVTSKKKQAVPVFVGTAPFKTVELVRELTKEEVSPLVDQLLKLKDVPEDKKKKLNELVSGYSNMASRLKFAFFSLTVFGKKFTGLRNYVTYRLAQATDQQIQILEFLSLTHVYTNFSFPVNALAKLLKTNSVILERVFRNDDVRELLSPPSADGRNLRRISFVEVAEELLQIQAEKRGLSYTVYLKDVALRLAKEALSSPRPSKRIHRITRRLYITSEFSSEKFSPLVRYIKDNDPDVARDMLSDLSGIFDKGSSVCAHLLAHLAKYHMIVYEEFESARPLIEEAASEHSEDVLLHHIHGDVIRLHVQNLKNQKDFSLDEILRLAIRSSSCFEIVREKRPLMEHGYSSDALVRKLVMLAAIKSKNSTKYVEFLKVFLEERQKTTHTSLSQEEKFIISLVPESFAFLRAVPINEYTARLKDDLLENLGDLEDLKAFCEELKTSVKGTTDEGWVDKAVLQTTSLVYALEVEGRQLDPDEADERIQELEKLITKTNVDDESMKIWIRCARIGSKIPTLKAVRDKVNTWLKVYRWKSAYALFYNYVVATLEALSDPRDTEKMKKVSECIKEILRKRSQRSKGVSEDPFLPIEWLHPKDGRSINSLDSLLYHEDLVRERLKGKSLQRQQRAGKEIVENALFQEKITKWEGVVSEIVSDWKGTICFKKHIMVQFVPVNVRPCMPNTGEEVHFCLGFHWTGPCAWYVVCRPGMAKSQKASASLLMKDIDSGSDTSEEEDEGGLAPLVEHSLHRQIVKPHTSHGNVEESVKRWDNHVDENMQGIIYHLSTEKGYGFIHHPEFEGDLFFHAKQIDPPVDSLNSVVTYSVVSFTIGKTSKGPRAMNIKVMEEGDIDPQLKECSEKFRKGEESQASVAAVAARPQRVNEIPTTLQDFHELGSRHEGHVAVLMSPTTCKSVHGFIEMPSICEKLFFHEEVSGIAKRESTNISLGTKVQFSVGRNQKGFYAKDLIIQRPESKLKRCKCGWEHLVDKGIQEGYVAVLKKESRYGFITDEAPKESCRNPIGLYFNDSHVRGIPFSQLKIGDRVHFIVGQNDKSCVAQQIDVQGGPSYPVAPQGNFGPPPPLGAFYPMQGGQPRPDVLNFPPFPSNGFPMGFPPSVPRNSQGYYGPGRSPAEGVDPWQEVRRRKR